jgi:hypothetical protein
MRKPDDAQAADPQTWAAGSEVKIETMGPARVMKASNSEGEPHSGQGEDVVERGPPDSELGWVGATGAQVPTYQRRRGWPSPRRQEREPSLPGWRCRNPRRGSHRSRRARAGGA